MALNEETKQKLAKVGYTPTEIEEDAISVVSGFITQTENLETWITPDVAMNMREVIKRARRNYLGVFEDDSTDHLDNEKIWHHITQSIVESEVKNTDLDPKDISVDSEAKSQIGVASLLRPHVKSWMREVDFGQDMDDDLRTRAIDGHVIRKVVDKLDWRTKKNIIDTREVDLLRFYIHGNASSLHTSAMAEMAIMSTSEIKKTYKNWVNLKYLLGKKSVRQYSETLDTIAQPEPMSEIFEYHAEIPEWWIHGNKATWEKDGEPYTLGIVIISNIDDMPVVHKIMKNRRGIKPYEESRLIKVKNRYVGLGRAEQLFGYQLYFNLIFNTRRVNQMLAANQLFQFKKTSGITPQLLAKVYTGGGIPVEEVGDIARVDTQNYSFQDSLNEERQLMDSAQRQTDQNDTALGGTLPASTPATVGVLQERAQGRGANHKKESFGRYLERLFNDHIFPELKKTLTKGRILRITGEPSEITKFDEAIIRYYVNEEYIKQVGKGRFVPPAQREKEIARLTQQARSMGKDRWVKIVQDYLKSDACRVVINVSNEHEDKNMQLNILNSILFNYAQNNPNVDSDALLTMIMDRLGVNSDLVMKPKSQQVAQQPQQPQKTQAAPGSPRAASVVPGENTLPSRVQGAINQNI